MDRFLRTGWSSQEATHRWTNGHTAQIHLFIPIGSIGDDDVVVRLRCRGFTLPGVVAAQQVEVRVNYQRVTTWSVAVEAWHEAVVPNARVRDGKMLVTLTMSHPTVPADHGVSIDPRALGLLALEMEVVRSPLPQVVDWLGVGVDPIGDVFRKDGNYFRAIRRDAMAQVDQLVANGIYDDLARRSLIPHQVMSAFDQGGYGALAMTTGALWAVYPGNYIFLTLLDAARVWLEINERLLDLAPEHDYGLADGHFGNFALFGNSRPQWVDIGSIVAGASAKNEKFSGWFGLDQFVRSFVYPLLMYFHKPERSAEVRQLMHVHYLGVPHDVLTGWLGPAHVLDFVQGQRAGMTRRNALALVRGHIEPLEYRPHRTNWSDYRNTTALDWACEGRYLQADQDPRYRAIVDLAAKAPGSTFLDVGANDGLFSVMCARAGKSGIATDVDDLSLNKLYQFLGHHPELPVTVAYAAFTQIDYAADLVLALALTHHLCLSQGLSFADIADRLDRVTRRALVTEFMPDGLGGTPGHPDPSPNPLPAAYSLQAYLDALKVYFAKVEVIDYHRPAPPSRRILIYCEKVAAVAALPPS